MKHSVGQKEDQGHWDPKRRASRFSMVHTMPRHYGTKQTQEG